MKICGRKITTAPIPPMMPSTSRLRSGPSGRRASIAAGQPGDGRLDPVHGELGPGEDGAEHEQHHGRQDQRSPDPVRQDRVEPVAPGDDRLDSGWSTTPSTTRATQP